MELREWMKTNAVTDTDLARRLGHDRTDSITRWKNKECVPQPRHMQLLIKITDGQVTANDFYDIQ